MTTKSFINHRVLWLLIPLLTLFNLSAWADITWTWTASSGALGTATSYDASLTGTTSPSTSSENTKAWHVARSSVVYTGWSSSCIQMGSGSGAETVTLTSSAFSGTIKSVAVVCGSYNGTHKVAISVGETSYLSATSTATWTSTNSKSGSGTSKGEISIAFTNGSRALYIKSITVTYAPNTTGPFTVTYDGNGKTSGSVPVDAVEHVKNSSVTVLGNTGSLAKTGYTFNGWNTAADGSGTAYAAGSSIASITQDMTLYAQWKSNAAEKVFYLVEDVSKLTATQNIVIVSYYSSAYYAMSTDQRTANRGQIAAGVTEFTMSNSNKTLTTASTTHIEMLTLTSTDAGYFGFQTLDGKYLYASSNSANELKSQASIDNNAKWKITLNTGVFTVQADKSSNRNHMRFNGGNDPKIFSCYSSATQTAVLIYAEPTCEELASINGSFCCTAI